MLILVRIVGIVIVGMGIIFLAKPQLYRQYMAFWQPGKRLYTGAVLAILFSVVLLLAATQCRLVGVIVGLGILSLVKGIILLTAEREKIRSMLKWWQERSLLVLRLMGLIALAIGALLIYSA